MGRAYVAMGETVFAMGGGNGLNFSRELWSTQDGSIWTALGNAAWPGRMFASAVVFRGRLLLLGGIVNAQGGGINDVWASQDQDGRDWRCLTTNAAWTPRWNAVLAVLDGRVFLMGGATNRWNTRLADVWMSPDGVQWTALGNAEPARSILPGDCCQSGGSSWHLRLAGLGVSTACRGAPMVHPSRLCLSLCNIPGRTDSVD